MSEMDHFQAHLAFISLMANSIHFMVLTWMYWEEVRHLLGFDNWGTHIGACGVLQLLQNIKRYKHIDGVILCTLQ